MDWVFSGKLYFVERFKWMGKQFEMGLTVIIARYWSASSYILWVLRFFEPIWYIDFKRLTNYLPYNKRIFSVINESFNEWRILSTWHKNFNYKYLLEKETIDNLLVLVNFGVESNTKTSHLLATL